jgi:hypothetical protein
LPKSMRGRGSISIIHYYECIKRFMNLIKGSMNIIFIPGAVEAQNSASSIILILNEQVPTTQWQGGSLKQLKQ